MSVSRGFFGSLGLALVLLAPALESAEPWATSEDLPRIPPVEVDDALATFQIRPGFKIEAVAHEPLIRDPIEICFDENGRMFVVEMIDYSELRDAQPHLGRIRLLEDTDEDGRFDRSEVYADDLPWPTGVACWQGGVFVAATPDIFYLKDTDGDGSADQRDVVFTGFAIDYAPYRTNELNMQAMLNSFRWGLDNRYYGCTAPNGGRITSPLQSEAKAVEVRGRDFAFDPQTMRLGSEAGGGQYGMSFDDAGRRYTCNNSIHIRSFMYDARYGERNPWVAMPSVLVDIATDGPAAPVFRTSPDEPWRVLRTKWRVDGLVPGPIEGGGRASGYFTSATGLMIYRGDAWPEAFLGDAFIADCGSNLVHRKQVRSEGVRLVAERPADERGVEFLSCSDIWFRPVQIANAPDGALYIIDMYREIIEHPWSLPPGIKEHLDLNSGNDRGRIYRVVPDGFRQRPLPRLGQAPTSALVRTLEHRNAWHRETAARLIYERQDRSAIPDLERLSAASPAALGRLHALYALAGLASLKPGQVLRGLADDDERVRMHAVRLAEPLIETNADVEQRLLGMVGDPSPAVRYQLAFTLGESAHPERIRALARIARSDVASAYARAAVLSSLAEGGGRMFEEVSRWFAESSVPPARPEEHEFLRQLVEMIGARNEPREVAAVSAFVAGAEPAVAFTLVHALGEGLKRARAPLDLANLKPVLEQATRLVPDADAALDTRVQAVELLSSTSYPASGPLLLGLLTQVEPQRIQLASIRALGRFDEPEVARELLQRWNVLTPRLRDAALSVLLARADRARLLLEAIDQGEIRRTMLSSVQVDFLTNHRDANLRRQAVAVLARQATAPPEAEIQAFLPALDLRGDPVRGKTLFVERCALCHRLGGEGIELGPDLVSVRTSGREKMLISILDPSREVLPQYIGFEVETDEDETIIGFVSRETATSVTLKQAYGLETTVQRSWITMMRSQGKSIMPDGLVADLDPQAVADLLEFLGTAEQ